MKASARLFGEIVLLAGLTTQSHAACRMVDVAELPVTMIDGFATVPVTIDSHTTQFFVDTGSPETFLLRPVALEFGLRPRSDGGGIDYAWVKDLSLGGSSLHNARLIVDSAGGEISKGGGVLGEDVLGGFDIEFDLAANRIRLFEPDGCSGDQVAYWATSYFMTKLVRAPGRSNQLETEADLAGTNVVVMFDSGINDSFISPSTLKRTGLNPDSLTKAAAPAEGSAGAGLNSYIATFGRLTLGQEVVWHPKLTVADELPNYRVLKIGHSYFTVADEADLVIGTDFLLAHRVYFARSEHMMYFTYNGGPVFRPSASVHAAAAAAPNEPQAGQVPSAAEQPAAAR